MLQVKHPKRGGCFFLCFCSPFCGGRRRLSFVAGGKLIVKLRWELMSVSNRSPAVESFYVSWIWRRCRKAFAESRGNICERCRKNGIIEPGSRDRPLEVHHKIPLTADNVKDPNVALNWENLELLCKSCHDSERERHQKRWRINPDGRVIL